MGRYPKKFFFCFKKDVLKQISLAACIVCICSCGNSTAGLKAEQEFMDNIRDISASRPDSALAVLDKGLAEGIISEENYKFWHATALYQTGRYDDSASEYDVLLNMIENEENLSDLRMEALRNLSFIRAMAGDYESAVRLCIVGDSLARVTGNVLLQADFCSNIGFYSQKGDKNVAVKYLEEAISLYRALDENLNLLQICQAELFLITALEENGDFKRALDVGKGCLENIKKAENSGVADKARIDRYRFNIYSCLTTVYAELGMKGKAREAFAEMQKTDSYGNFINDKVLVNPLMAVSEFAAAEAILEKYRDALEAQIQKDSLCMNYNYLETLRLQKECWTALGNKDKEAQTVDLLDSLNKESEVEKMNLKIKALSASYEVRKKEYELQEANLKIRVGHMKIVSLLVISVLLTGIIIVYIRLNRRIMAKNSKLSEYVANPSKPSRKTATDDVAHEDVSRFISVLKSRELFADSGFNENILLSELNIRNRNFRSDFKADTGKTLPQYLTELRVAKAAELIRNFPQYTFEYIAEKSGFGSRTTMYRAFSTHYGLSPKEYRSQL